MNNFMLSDMAGTAAASALFAIFLLPPGYLLTQAFDLLSARRATVVERVLLALAFSLVATPIVSVLLVRYVGFTATLTLFLAMAAAAVVMEWRVIRHQRSSIFPIARCTWQALAMAAVWFVLVLISLADLQLGERLYPSYLMYDHAIRIPMVASAARTGVPPLNPFYAIPQMVPQSYFYYWYVVCALPARLAGISAKACLSASAFWCGLGLFAMAALFLKHMMGVTHDLRRRAVVSGALIFLTGLDLIPYMFLSVPPWAIARADLDWWNQNQITSWVASLLWVPHHVAAMLACMAGLLVLAQLHRDNTARAWATVLVAGMAFASAAGLSIYVTFTFAIVLVAWSLWMLLRGHLRLFAFYAASGVVSLLLSLPYLGDLLRGRFTSDAASATTHSHGLAFFALREGAPMVDPLRQFHPHTALLNLAVRLPGMVVTYAVEFGFFAVVLVLALRRDLRAKQPLPAGRRMMWFVFWVSLLAMSCLKSDATGVNDLGFRGILITQFILLVLAAPVLSDAIREKTQGIAWARLCLLFTILLGAAGSAYQLASLRLYAPLVDHGHKARDESFLGAAHFGERNYQLRAGYRQLDRLLPADARIQYNPIRDEVRVENYYSPRQAAMGDFNCEAGFGGSQVDCQQAVAPVVALFNPARGTHSDTVDEVCRRFHLSVLVSTDVDPAWQQKDSWVWQRKTLVANPGMRAIACPSAEQQ